MRRQTRVRRAVCVFAGLALLAGGGDAFAQSDGVVVDPESPAGKEYALPLDKARQDVAPAPGAGGTKRSGDTPLFGAGITKRHGAQRDDRSGSNGRGEGGGQDNSRGGGGVDATSVAAAAAGGSGLSSGWLTALVAMGVLLVGGIVGVALRALRTTERG